MQIQYRGCLSLGDRQQKYQQPRYCGSLENIPYLTLGAQFNKKIMLTSNIAQGQVIMSTERVGETFIYTRPSMGLLPDT